MAIHVIQISDVHLGRTFGGLGLPGELADQLAAAALDAVRKACDLVKAHCAAALLVAGDLFDNPDVDEPLLERVQGLFADLAPHPVLVCPGNHDAFGPVSVWNNDALHRLGLDRWPDNVHVFATRRLTPHPLPNHDLVVYGHRVEGYHSLDDSPLADFRVETSARWNVLLLHGGLSHPGFDPRGTVPFTLEQLAAVNAHYAAVGHYHSFRKLEHDGRLLGAYTGVPVPGHVDEDPHGAVLVIRLDDDGPHVEPVDTYPGRIAKLAVAGDPFADFDDAQSKIRSQADRQDLGSDDIVFVRLTGISRTELDADRLTEELAPHFHYLTVIDETEPDLLSEIALDAGRVTVESQFVGRIQDEIDRCTDPQRRAILQRACNYGLLALHRRAVRPPQRDPTNPAQPE